MSGAEIIQSKNQETEHDSYLKTHHDMIYHYKNYIITIYGGDAWESLISEDRFNTLFYETVYRYGIAVFQEIVNMTSDHFDITISDILKSFGQYYNNHN